ncbi:MAG: hypothetical protein FJ276_35405 [Planctomycetes bacterium]|nr:hypothetical protein [Planctomycetota bacterium]
MAVVIRKRPSQDGTTYEIEDFDTYVEQLRRIGITAPSAKYRIFVSTTTAQDIAMSGADIESQIALFFRLGPASGIEYEFRGPQA